jgi:hypothetical protein
MHKHTDLGYSAQGDNWAVDTMEYPISVLISMAVPHHA